MIVYAFEPLGFEGELVTVEVDLRRGIPSVDLVGLPDGAVKEARERIRAAVRNSGFEFPLERLLISLAPAGVRKGGASFDLAMALAVLVASGQVPDVGSPVLALGELELSGRVRPVSGVLSAIAAGLRAGVPSFIVPRGNLAEARALAGDSAYAIDGLFDSVRLAAALRGLGSVEAFRPQADPDPRLRPSPIHDTIRSEASDEGSLDGGADMADIRGQAGLRRAMEVAAAGGHHMLLFGPPGVGKSMAARRLAGLLPDLDDDDAVVVTTLHSLAGTLSERSGLMRRPPFRAPHHGASAEGIVGGGRSRKPGEISLAHGGVLLLDEAAEFRSDVLQSLREPLEDGVVSIVRADRVVAYPSRFMLVLACNPCPCGNLGRRGAVCLCSAEEIRRYWKRLGGPLLDRIDLRVPVKPAGPSELASGPGEPSSSIKARVERARARQLNRYGSLPFRLNAGIPASAIETFCALGSEARVSFSDQAESAGFSSRASHSTLRVARTIADLDEASRIELKHVNEAIQLRRYGDGDVYWLIP
ncbi:MAG: YifB family Mg chelatase-like AAA ATPase [Spirochaetes bacterium]|nr:YifB family Mg chelatase-like AAA ATPase [Spirochaetota bacterium]MBU1079731.1 YifB family Mg chelatase-like AAA ATPase [Spirochaetota bacterium]